jgi:1-acyl-sn-glycerol-3-phosphate acyltransferase
MGKIIAAIKFLLVFMTIGLYFLLTMPLYPLMYISKYKTKKLLNHLVGYCARTALIILNVKINIQGKENIQKGENYFVVSNHLSYLDILVFSSFFATGYVTSMEVKKTPFLGQIADLAGCLYVDRKNKKNIKNEIKDIENALMEGLSVTVFPEATSTNGEQILKFKRSLFQSAINTTIRVLPMTINYKKVNGEPINKVTRDSVCWYGDMEFAPHLWDLCQTSSVEVDIVLSQPVTVKEQYDCSAILRDDCYEIVTSQFSAIV